MSEQKKVEVIVSVSTNRIGSLSETSLYFDADEWESMSENYRANLCREVMFELIDWSWRVSENSE